MWSIVLWTVWSGKVSPELILPGEDAAVAAAAAAAAAAA